MTDYLLLVVNILNLVFPFITAFSFHWRATNWWPRQDLFFGVRVVPGFASSEEGRSISRQYLLILWGSTVCFAVTSLFLRQTDANMLAIMGVATVGLSASTWAAYRAKAHELVLPAAEVRIASLAASEEATPLWVEMLDWAGMVVPMCLPTLAIAILWANFAKISASNPVMLTSQLAVGLAIGLLCSYSQWALRFRSRSADWAASDLLSRKYRVMLGVSQSSLFTLISTQLCYLSLMPLIGYNMWLYFGITLPLQLLLFPFLSRMRKWLEANLMEQGSRSFPEKCWKAGFYYANPEDPALVVPNKAGIGFSFNFARPSVLIVFNFVILGLAASLAGSIWMMRSLP